MIAPPAPYFEQTRQLLRKDLHVSTQNIHAMHSGTFTIHQPTNENKVLLLLTLSSNENKVLLLVNYLS